MDYLLANELKNAGFPQGGRGRWIVDPNRIVVRSEDRAYVPTLEELIEACADDFGAYVDGTVLRGSAQGLANWGRLFKTAKLPPKPLRTYGSHLTRNETQLPRTAGFSSILFWEAERVDFDYDGRQLIVRPRKAIAA